MEYNAMITYNKLDNAIPYDGYYYKIAYDTSLASSKVSINRYMLLSTGDYAYTDSLSLDGNLTSALIDHMIGYVAASNCLSKQDISFTLEYYNDINAMLKALNNMYIDASRINKGSISHD